jgi:hypothetical protein
VCGSKFHLIKDCNFHEQRMDACARQQTSKPVWQNVNAIPPYMPQSAFRSNRYNSADRPSPSNWRNSVARPYMRPTNTYYNHGYWPGYFDPMSVGMGFWDTAVKSSADCSWKKKGPNFQWRSKNNGGSNKSTWPNSHDPQGRFKSAMT